MFFLFVSALLVWFLIMGCFGIFSPRILYVIFVGSLDYLVLSYHVAPYLICLAYF
jgi:hypothetical protein